MPCVLVPKATEESANGRGQTFLGPGGVPVFPNKSRRNCQLGLFPTGQVAFQLSKLHEGALALSGGAKSGYRLAFTAPLTPFTAFAIALSQLSDKHLV